ncbi:MAG: DUF4349 domain-containing protein [Zoogloea sp.]|uniref:DUF4349 domain-containing protein n=1 Tax=Zoogloea sp. TaxID=49181 RepID=UPI003F2F4432
MTLLRCAFALPRPLLIPPLALSLAVTACGQKQEVPESGGVAAAVAPRMAMAAKMGDAVAEPAQAGRFMAYEHTLELDVDGAQVATVHKTLETACAAAQAEGCVVLESSLGSGRYPVARVRLRASPAGIKALLARLGREGQIIRQSVQAEDLAEPMNDTRRRLKMQEDYRSQLELLRQQAGRDVDALIKITRELAQTQDEIEALAGQRAQLERRVNTELLNVQIAPRTGSASWQPVQNALDDFGGRLAEGCANLVTALAYGLPWLGVIGLLGLALKRYRRAKERG